MHSAVSRVIAPSAVVPPTLTPSVSHKCGGQIVAAAQLARQAAADPEPRFAERVFRTSKEAIKGHRVLDFRRGQVENVGNFANRVERHAAVLVLDDVQAGNVTACLLG